MSRTIIVLALLSSLLSCQFITRSSSQQLPLLSPQYWPTNMQATQVIRLQRGAKIEHITAVLALTEQKVTLVALSPVGQRLFSLRYDGVAVQVDSSVAAQALPAHGIIALLQLALWPEASLRQAYGSPWQLQIDPNHRRLYRTEHLMVEVELADWRETWPYLIRINNAAANLKLEITTVDYQAL